MKNKGVLLKSFFLIALLLFHGPAHAVCTSPDGVEGQIVYNSDYNVVQYCNGVEWMPAGLADPQAASGTCSSPDGGEGEIVYNTTHKTMQFCNGENWIAMKGGNMPACPGSANLVAHWTFDTVDVDYALTGEELRDVSGAGNHALYFDAGDGQISMIDGVMGEAFTAPLDSSFDLISPVGLSTSEITLAGWVRPNVLVNFINIYRSHGWPNTTGSYVLYTSNSGNAFFGISDGTQKAVVASGIQAGVWAHLAGTYDGTLLKIYFNGELVDTRELPGLSLDNTLQINVAPAANHAVYDDFWVFGRALSALEIRDLYGNGIRCL